MSHGRTSEATSDVVILLASASPRRRSLLEQAGVRCEVRAVEVDESVRAGEGAFDYLERVVAAKLAAARLNLTLEHRAVLVADTSVLCGGAILGKPESVLHAERMIAELSGRAHQVATRFALFAPAQELLIARTVITEVHVCQLTPEEIAAYVRTGEGADKAGGYAIQGRFGAAIAGIHGSYSNVVGLPLVEVLDALREVGVDARFGAAST